MSWRKHFKIQNSPLTLANRPSDGGIDSKYMHYASHLPDVYVGHPNRIERYNQYENMDTDSEVKAALDILAEFCTQVNDDTNTPFQVIWHEDPSDSEAETVVKQLKNWSNLNEMNKRIFKMFRQTLKYGDQVFVRDPETFEISWVDMSDVIKVIVNESKGKEPEQYVIANLNPNFENLTATQKTYKDDYIRSQAQPDGYLQPSSPYASGNAGGGIGAGRFERGLHEYAIESQHIVHLSLTEGLDVNWPFGNSILEDIFKVYKQKELLEDSILIYRIQRAPERRAFYVDVGDMPSHMAMSFIERVKNEIHQRRIPSQTGGGNNIMDTTYNPLCLDLETKIPLLDGRTLTLNEIIEEFESGRENWAYSVNPETGESVPGVINWAGVTRRDTDVIELSFDNGKTLICTPDHKIPVLGKGFIEAQNLTPDDSLIAFNRQNKPISGGKTNEYEQVWDHSTNSWKWTHRMVGEFFRAKNKHQEFTYLEENAGKPKTVIHHRDHDRFNNDPRNIAYMDKEDHVLYHAAQKADFWANMTPEYREQITGKISSTLKKNWQNKTDQERLDALWNIRQAQKKSVWMRQNDPDTKASYKKNAGDSRRRYIQENPDFREQLFKNLENRVHWKNQEINLTRDMLQVIVGYVNKGEKNQKRVIELCDRDPLMKDLLVEANPQDDSVTQNKINYDCFGASKMKRIIRQFGYKNWKDFVAKAHNYNHRVVSVRRVSNRDTGTITIDGTERWHDYHTFAIDAGIYVKNSMNEDYFFPQTADGRGSKVEVLPGGQNLGEIDDLRYFTNKLFRGLRIPSSYLPTGPDEAQQPYNDGRVGTALIQEKRFNEYCKRLQRYVVDTLDREFKMFLKYRGLELDNGSFELQFSEPQNFAAYREIEVDQARIGTFTQLEGFPYFSKRYLMEEYLGMTEEQIARNERMWAEENTEETESDDINMRSVGVTPGGMEGDIENFEDMGGDEDFDMGDEGDMDADIDDLGGGDEPQPES